MKVLGLLLGIVLASACDALDPYSDLPLEGEPLKRAQVRARNEGELWLDALEEFRQGYGRYPSGQEGLRFLVVYPDPNEHPEWDGPYGAIDRTFLNDPWKMRYQLRSTDVRIAVVSGGPDRRFDTGDDIVVSREVNYWD